MPVCLFVLGGVIPGSHRSSLRKKLPEPLLEYLKLLFVFNASFHHIYLIYYILY